MGGFEADYFRTTTFSASPVALEDFGDDCQNNIIFPKFSVTKGGTECNYQSNLVLLALLEAVEVPEANCCCNIILAKTQGILEGFEVDYNQPSI